MWKVQWMGACGLLGTLLLSPPNEVSQAAPPFGGNVNNNNINLNLIMQGIGGAGGCMVKNTGAQPGNLGFQAKKPGNLGMQPKFNQFGLPGQANPFQQPQANKGGQGKGIQGNPFQNPLANKGGQGKGVQGKGGQGKGPGPNLVNPLAQNKGPGGLPFQNNFPSQGKGKGKGKGQQGFPGIGQFPRVP